MTEERKWIGIGEIDRLIEKLEMITKAIPLGTEEKMGERRIAERENTEEELKKLGIIFGCGDYGDDYCLSPEGARVVLKAVKRLILRKGGTQCPKKD